MSTERSLYQLIVGVGMLGYVVLTYVARRWYFRPPAGQDPFKKPAFSRERWIPSWRMRHWFVGRGFLLHTIGGVFCLAAVVALTAHLLGW
jgi:hypothetical protein